MSETNDVIERLQARFQQLEDRMKALERGQAAPVAEPPTAASSKPLMPEDGELRPVEVVSVDAKTTGPVAEGQYRLSWKLVLRNLKGRTMLVSARILFVDLDSFAMEEVFVEDLRLSGDGDRQKFSGFIIVSPETADAVMGVKAHVREMD